MAITQTGRVLLSMELRSVIQDGVNAGVIPAKILEDLNLNNGTSVGSIDKGYGITESAKAASSTTTYDLTSLSYYGSTITFAEVVLVALRNKRTTASAHLDIGPDSSNGFGNTGPWADASDRNRVGPEGWFVMYDPAGWAVDGTHKVLDVITSAVAGSTNSWDLIILGRSA